MAVFSAGYPLVVKEVEGRELPSPRWSVQATVVGKIIYLSGGQDGGDILTRLLSGNPAGQDWQETVGTGEAMTFTISSIHCN